MEKLSSDILEDEFIKIFEPIHGVQYLAGFHRVKIEHKYVTAPSIYYQIYSSVVWALNIIAVVYFELYCEIKLEGISKVYTLQICEFIFVMSNAVIAFRNNFCDGTLNSQIYVKLQKIDRVVKMPAAVNCNRKMYLLSALLAVVIPVCWCICVYALNITSMRSVCPALFFVQFSTMPSYMENILAATILLFLAKRLNYVNVTLEKEAKRLRHANISLAASQYYREREQDQDQLVLAIHYILDSWADCIRLFQFQGVKQGDPLSPKLFTSCLEEVFKKLAVSWETKGIEVGDKRLTNLRFADDNVLFSTSATELQCMLQELSNASLEVGLTMNRSKTQLMTNSKKHRQKGKLPIALKRKLVDMCILPILTYGAQTWSLTEAQKSRLKVCQRAMERSILGVRRSDRVRNTELRSKTRVVDVGVKTARLKWDWAGHVCRMHVTDGPK
ncbi:uncharacterized protein LOC134806684 [Cydia splendana]|uniref:uncharacterized protein LOC134806684 n=1 Tax=Cydia splendana TaxID=1100963 RepID=UPI00300C6685